MARWLEAWNLRPDRVLGSSARRARETVTEMHDALPSLPKPEVSEALYNADPGTIMHHPMQ
jgi:phosphohistidine phosphatase SixA